MRPLVLIYHGVPRRQNAGAFHADTFEKHMVFLKKHCTFVSPEEYPTARYNLRRPSLLLTFDDGLRNNAEVVAPILRRLNVPAVFFVSSRHCTPEAYLWFSYLNMLQWHFPGESVTLNGKFISLAGDSRGRGMRELTSALLSLRPHPQAMYAAIASQLPRLQDFVPASVLEDECYGMTPEQVRELGNDPLFTVGGHTLDHPYLTSCDSQELVRQVQNNKEWLESVTGKKCDLFAYPLGDFDSGVVNACRTVGFDRAFATEWGAVSDERFAIRRAGIYRAGLALLPVKVWLGHWLPMQFIHAVRTAVQA